MSGVASLLDVAIGCALTLLGWFVVRVPELSRAVALFIAFGFVSALAWTRLDAVDVALVEASIGAGLSGALFVTSLPWASVRPRAGGSWPWAAPAATLLALGLGTAVTALPRGDPGLAGLVAENARGAGAPHPITAVLMSFRGYDTLLETSVLIAAVGAVGVVPTIAPRAGSDVGVSSLLAGLSALLLPLGVVVAGYLLWRGASGPGGAFQAGSVLAGAGVVRMLGSRLGAPDVGSIRSRALLAVGPLVFLAFGAWPLLEGRPLLAHRPEHAATSILAIETALTCTIAVVLTTFFPRAAPALRASNDRARRERSDEPR